MAKANFNLSNTAKAVIAIIAGIIILFQWVQLYLVVGIFLIVWGILALIDR